ncbi:MAG: anti-sigma factor antagonist [Betaproteobacteria bacterium]|nr:anti-sigma factor antagonist [Betaproteobacteria bacterium]
MDAESIAAGLLAALPSIRADAVAYLRDNLSAGASRTDVQQSNGTMRIKLNGRFDFSAHRAFRDAYSPGIDATDVRQIDIDLAQVDYLDSSALGMLLMLREKAQAASKGIKLTNCKGSVRQVLDIANFSKLFEMG